MRVIFLAVASTVLGGCIATSNVSQFTEQSPDQVAQQVKIETSEFDNSISYVGPILSDRYASYFLRAYKMKDTGRILLYQIYVSAQYGDVLRPRNSGRSWIFYNSAATEGGENYDVTRIGRDVDCRNSNCFYTEDFGFKIPEELLMSRQNSGLPFRVENVNGSGAMVLYIPASYIKGFLTAMKSM